MTAIYINIKEAITQRVLSVLKFNDEKWRGLNFDDSSKEILLPLIEEYLVDLNLYLEEQPEPNTICIRTNHKGNFRLHDLILGIYWYHDHCFHLNGHGNPTLSLIELCRMCKLNPDCCYHQSENCRELATEIQTASHQSRGWVKCPILILSRSIKLQLTVADTYNSSLQLNLNDETWKELRYLKLEDGVKRIQSMLKELKEEEKEFRRDGNLSHLINVIRTIVPHEKKKKEIQLHLNNLSVCLDQPRKTFCDPLIETQIENFIKNNKDYPRVGKSLCTLRKELSTFIIYIIEGFTSREVELTWRLMEEWKNIRLILF